tara:strand:- start:2591 stop:2767 length:177 start_codon:yes stop_codon:yes gene_type:complete
MSQGDPLYQLLVRIDFQLCDAILTGMIREDYLERFKELRKEVDDYKENYIKEELKNNE